MKLFIGPAIIVQIQKITFISIIKKKPKTSTIKKYIMVNQTAVGFRINSYHILL
jgi:hypothetical protein